MAKIPAAIQRYGLAGLSVAIALGTALLLERYSFRAVEFPLFLFAVALTVWYAGVGPAILAVVLSSLAFDYYFTEPLHSLTVTRSDVPYFIVFVLFALLLTWFSAVRHRVERDLLQSRDELAQEVTVRTQQASLLNLTHDTIFVRDMSDLITHWNRGAQELFGWTMEQAIGKHAHQLLRNRVCQEMSPCSRFSSRRTREYLDWSNRDRGPRGVAATLQSGGSRSSLDLEDVTLIDRDAVAYIREWIGREEMSR